MRNMKSDFEVMGLITTNRLSLGRNNEKSPVGSVTTASSFEKMIKDNKSIFNSWFENWLLSHVPKLM